MPTIYIEQATHFFQALQLPPSYQLNLATNQQAWCNYLMGYNSVVNSEVFDSNATPQELLNGAKTESPNQLFSKVLDIALFMQKQQKESALFYFFLADHLLSHAENFSDPLLKKLVIDSIIMLTDKHEGDELIHLNYSYISLDVLDVNYYNDSYLTKIQTSCIAQELYRFFYKCNIYMQNNKDDLPFTSTQIAKLLKLSTHCLQTWALKTHDEEFVKVITLFSELVDKFLKTETDTYSDEVYDSLTLSLAQEFFEMKFSAIMVAYLGQTSIQLYMAVLGLLEVYISDNVIGLYCSYYPQQASLIHYSVILNWLDEKLKQPTFLNPPTLAEQALLKAIQVDLLEINELSQRIVNYRTVIESLAMEWKNYLGGFLQTVRLGPDNFTLLKLLIDVEVSELPTIYNNLSNGIFERLRKHEQVSVIPLIKQPEPLAEPVDVLSNLSSKRPIPAKKSSNVKPRKDKSKPNLLIDTLHITPTIELYPQEKAVWIDAFKPLPDTIIQSLGKIVAKNQLLSKVNSTASQLNELASEIEVLKESVKKYPSNNSNALALLSVFQTHIQLQLLNSSSAINKNSSKNIRDELIKKEEYFSTIKNLTQQLERFSSQESSLNLDRAIGYEGVLKQINLLSTVVPAALSDFEKEKIRATTKADGLDKKIVKSNRNSKKAKVKRQPKKKTPKTAAVSKPQKKSEPLINLTEAVNEPTQSGTSEKILQNEVVEFSEAVQLNNTLVLNQSPSPVYHPNFFHTPFTHSEDDSQYDFIPGVLGTVGFFRVPKNSFVPVPPLLTFTNNNFAQLSLIDQDYLLSYLTPIFYDVFEKNHGIIVEQQGLHITLTILMPFSAETVIPPSVEPPDGVSFNIQHLVKNSRECIYAVKCDNCEVQALVTNLQEDVRRQLSVEKINNSM